MANDTNGRWDVFVRDQLTGTTGFLTIWEPAPVADFTGLPTSGAASLTMTETTADAPTGSGSGTLTIYIPELVAHVRIQCIERIRISPEYLEQEAGI